MKQEQIKELISKARNAAKAPEFVRLIDTFEAFSELFSQKDRLKQGAPGREEFLQKLAAAHKNFWLSFEQVATHFGMTPDLLRNYFENPNNFTPEQWQSAQAAKQEVLEEKEDASSQEKLKKLQKTNRKMRI